MSESISPEQVRLLGRRVRHVVDKVSLIVLGTAIAVVIGAVAGFVVGALLAYLWSTPRQPPSNFAAFRQWGSLVGALASGTFVLVRVAAQPFLKHQREHLEAERRDYYRVWRDAGYAPQEVAEFETTMAVIVRRANTALAVAAVAALLFVFHTAFQHFVGHQVIGVSLVAFGLPALAWVAFSPRRSDFWKTWAAAGAVILVCFSARAVSTAFFHEYANCWRVAKQGQWDVLDCAPGSEPVQSPPTYSFWTQDLVGTGTVCERTYRDVGTATRWRCHPISN